MKKDFLTIQLPAQMKRDLKGLAKERGISLSDTVRVIIAAHIQTLNEQKAAGAAA